MNTGIRLAVLISFFTLAASPHVLAQTKPVPKTAKPPAKAAPPAKKAAPAPVAAAAPPPPPTDIRYKTKYTTGDQVTESATFITSQRERYELGDIILIRQRDQKRNVQISKSANTYVTVADDVPVATPAAPRPAGVISLTTSIVDIGDRKDVFGQTARHVRTVMQRQPEPGACDQSKFLTEIDGWYIDMPKVLAAAPEAPKSANASGCTDEVKTTETGDAKLLGFAISYTTTLTDLADKDAKPAVSSMEVSELEVLKLDASLFDIPAGATAAADAAAFTKAVSDANEARLARGAVESVAPAKKAGTLRVGVPEFGNKTSNTVDTRALRARIITELEHEKIEAVPMAAAPQAELDARAKELGVDYLLIAEITDMKASKPGGITKMMKATAKEEARDITEAKLNVQLVPVGGGKPRLAKNASGKDGGVGLKTGLKLAKFAGSVYLKFYLGGMMGGQMSAYSQMQMMNIGGMGNVGSMMPMMTGGRSVDRTAGAASYVMQQVLAGAATSQSGPSFDAALEDAIEDAGKDVIDSIKKATATKK